MTKPIKVSSGIPTEFTPTESDIYLGSDVFVGSANTYTFASTDPSHIILRVGGRSSYAVNPPSASGNIGQVRTFTRDNAYSVSISTVPTVSTVSAVVAGTFNLNGSRYYAFASTLLTLLDTSNGVSLATKSFVGDPVSTNAVLDPDDSRIYVGTSGSTKKIFFVAAGSLTQVAATLPMTPSGVAVDGVSTNKVYICSDDATSPQIRSASGSPLVLSGTVYSSGIKHKSIACSPTKIFAARQTPTPHIDIIDISTQSSLGSITVGSSSYIVTDLSYNATHDYLIVPYYDPASTTAGGINIYSGTDYSLIASAASLPTGGSSPRTLRACMSPDGSYIYSTFKNNSVYVYSGYKFSSQIVLDDIYTPITNGNSVVGIANTGTGIIIATVDPTATSKIDFTTQIIATTETTFIDVYADDPDDPISLGINDSVQMVAVTHPTAPTSRWVVVDRGHAKLAGTTTVDFGSGNSTATATVTLPADARITRIQTSVAAIASADHTADEHLVEEIDVRAGNVVAGTSFTLYAKTRNTKLYGKYNINWSVS